MQNNAGNPSTTIEKANSEISNATCGDSTIAGGTNSDQTNDAKKSVRRVKKSVSFRADSEPEPVVHNHVINSTADTETKSKREKDRNSITRAFRARSLSSKSDVAKTRLSRRASEPTHEVVASSSSRETDSKTTVHPGAAIVSDITDSRQHLQSIEQRTCASGPLTTVVAECGALAAASERHSNGERVQNSDVEMASKSSTVSDSRRRMSQPPSSWCPGCCYSCNSMPMSDLPVRHQTCGRRRNCCCSSNNGLDWFVDLSVDIPPVSNSRAGNGRLSSSKSLPLVDIIATPKTMRKSLSSKTTETGGKKIGNSSIANSKSSSGLVNSASFSEPHGSGGGLKRPRRPMRSRSYRDWCQAPRACFRCQCSSEERDVLDGISTTTISQCKKCLQEAADEASDLSKSLLSPTMDRPIPSSPIDADWRTACELLGCRRGATASSATKPLSRSYSLRNLSASSVRSPSLLGALHKTEGEPRATEQNDNSLHRTKTSSRTRILTSISSLTAADSRRQYKRNNGKQTPDGTESVPSDDNAPKSSALSERYQLLVNSDWNGRRSSKNEDDQQEHVSSSPNVGEFSNDSTAKLLRHRPDFVLYI